MLSLPDPDLVKVDESVTRCTVDGWQRRVSIYNEPDESSEETAADVASAQVDTIYLNPGTDAFFNEIAAAITEQDSSVSGRGYVIFPLFLTSTVVLLLPGASRCWFFTL